MPTSFLKLILPLGSWFTLSCLPRDLIPLFIPSSSPPLWFLCGTASRNFSFPYLQLLESVFLARTENCLYNCLQNITTWMPVGTSNPKLIQNVNSSFPFNTPPLRSWLHSLDEDLMLLQLLRLTRSQLVNLIYSTILPILAASYTSHLGHSATFKVNTALLPCSLQLISCSHLSKDQPVHLPFLLKNLLLPTGK